VKLKEAGIRAFFDDSAERPGAKYYRWEMKGVPLRIEIGPRDIRNNRCVFVRRDDFSKLQVPISNVVPEAKRALNEIHTCIAKRAKETFFAHVSEGEGEMETLSSTAPGIVSIFLCEREKCGQEVVARLGAGVTVLGEPIEGDKAEGAEKSAEGNCIICSRKGRRVYIAKAY